MKKTAGWLVGVLCAACIGVLILQTECGAASDSRGGVLGGDGNEKDVKPSTNVVSTNLAASVNVNAKDQGNAKYESQAFQAAKASGNPDAFAKFLSEYPESQLLRAFEGEMTFGMTIVNPGDGKWQRQYCLKPETNKGDMILFSKLEAETWGLASSGRSVGSFLSGIDGTVTVYAEPTSMKSSQKYICWHILALKRNPKKQESK